MLVYKLNPNNLFQIKKKEQAIWSDLLRLSVNEYRKVKVTVRLRFSVDENRKVKVTKLSRATSFVSKSNF